MVEVVTSYPLFPYPFREVEPNRVADQEIVRRLGVIEDCLSRIEVLLAKLQPSE